ncbi:MAG: aminoacyl-tRNA hydrolase [Clostridia bacterium]|nr:aminoacyl-tRNA hydrolase [Clostridia bacterium]
MFFRKKSGPVDFLAVGLGNPGKEYANTRHNAGQIAVSALAADAGVQLTRAKFKSLTAEATFDGVRVLLMLPQTYMNLSGQAVAEAAKFYKIPPERVLVFSDDVALDVGKVRVRRKGSDGGQKGLRNITEQLGTTEFPRIRLGVGAKPHPEMEMADWVLSRFHSDERKSIDEAAANAVAAAKLVFAGDIDGAMNRYSR